LRVPAVALGAQEIGRAGAQPHGEQPQSAELEILNRIDDAAA